MATAQVEGACDANPGISEVAVEPNVKVDSVAVVAPLYEVFQVDGKQNLPGPVKVAALTAEFELGQLRGEIIESSPFLPLFLRSGEVVGAAAT